MRLVIGNELKRVAMNPKFPHKLAFVEEMLELWPELRRPEKGASILFEMAVLRYESCWRGWQSIARKRINDREGVLITRLFSCSRRFLILQR
jgi:hypothetical protein